MIELTLFLAAAAQSAAPPTTHERRTKDGDRIVCRSLMRTGTRRATRTCLTVRQWEIIDEHGQELIREVQRKPQFEMD